MSCSLSDSPHWIRPCTVRSGQALVHKWVDCFRERRLGFFRSSRYWFARRGAKAPFAHWTWETLNACKLLLSCPCDIYKAAKRYRDTILAQWGESQAPSHILSTPWSKYRTDTVWYRPELRWSAPRITVSDLGKSFAVKQSPLVSPTHSHLCWA